MSVDGHDPVSSRTTIAARPPAVCAGRDTPDVCDGTRTPDERAVTLALGLLSDLAPSERREVVATMHRHTFEAGEVVFHEGDAADSVHFVVEGRVIARRASEQGDRLAYAVMGPGQAFGELAMIVRGGRRTATVETVEPTVTLSLAFADFERLCVRHPEVDRLLVRLLAARVSRLTEALMEALHTPAELRVVRTLLSLSSAYALGTQLHSPVTVPLNQSELAELAGVTRPTANRVLRRLESAGIVALDRGRVSVRDPMALRRNAIGKRPPGYARADA
jgi:CRP/FNR family transcriptional regulator, cyclic AMP receptor protein